MKNFALIPILLCWFCSLDAQNKIEVLYDEPKNVVYLGILGDVSAGSFNYERLFSFRSYLDANGKSKQVFFLSAKVGLGSADNTVSEEWNPFITLPIHITANIGRRINFGEIGFGTTFIFDNPNKPNVAYLIAGYRRQPSKKFKFFLRVSFNVPFSLKVFARGSHVLFIPIGFGFGTSF